MPTADRRRRGFTLVELIVAVVIVALLVALASVGYTRWANDARDNATYAQVRNIAQAVLIEASATGAVSYDVAHFEKVAGQLGPVAATAVGSPLAAAGALEVVLDGPSNHPGQLAVAITPGGARAGLALASATGRCAYASLDGASLRTREPALVDAGECTGTAAMALPPAPGAGEQGPPGDGQVVTELAVTTTPAGAPTDVTVTWVAVPGATGYRLSVDGHLRATPTGTTHVVEGLVAGEHEVVVTVLGGPSAGATGTASFTVTLPANGNDNVENAYTLAFASAGTSALEVESDLTDATLQPGEVAPGYRSQWWRITPETTRAVRLETEASRKHLRLLVADPVTGLPDLRQTGQETTMIQPRHKHTWILEGGRTYYLRWAQTYNSATPTNQPAFTFRLTAGPANDMVAEAIEIHPAEHPQSFTGDPEYTTVEPGEQGKRSAWWKFTPTVNRAYGFTIPLEASSHLNVVEADPSTGLPDLSNLGPVYHGTPRPDHNIHLQAGKTYFFRWFYQGWDGGLEPPYTWTLTPAPMNAAAQHAIAIPVRDEPQTFTGVYDLAGTEPFEPSNRGNRSLWWKLTPPRDRQYQFSTPEQDYLDIYEADPATGLIDPTKRVAGASGKAYSTKTTLTGGRTYYIRWAGRYIDRSLPVTWTLSPL